MTNQNAMLALMQDVAREGLEVAPPGSRVAARFRAMDSFYGYLVTELPALLQRWRDSRL